MGTFGVGLYQDDAAADLRKTIALLAQIPASGERLLDILVENYEDGVGFDDSGGPTFWLVVADQFERRGIVCAKAFERALSAVDTGADLRDLESRGAGPEDLKKRVTILSALAERLRSPRSERPRPKRSKPPPFVVDVGEVYQFPTMRGAAFNAWAASWEAVGFKPDGWSALLVVARGREFDWFPWCAVSSLTVDPSREPSLADAMGARLIPTEHGAGLCVPTRKHLDRMKMHLLGRLNLDPPQAAKLVSREFTPRFAVLAGWSIASEARGWRGGSQHGVAVSELLESRS